MKKCLFLLLMLISVSVMGQDTYKVYCELVGQGRILSTKVNVSVDFGQETSFWKQSSNQYLVDEDGKMIKFNSMVDAMNYMGRLGWEFEQAYTVTTGQQNVYHWLLSKEVTGDVESMDGITTIEQYKKAEKQSEESEVEEEKQDKPKKKRRVINDDVYFNPRP